MNGQMRVAVLAYLFVAPGYTELFLVTGSYNQSWNYASESKLIRIDARGSVSTAALLVSASDGFVWAGLSYQARTAAVLVLGKAPMIRFISFRTGRVTKQCELPQDYGSPYWADVPGKGPVIEFKHLHWPPLQDESLDEISADEGIPCTESFAKTPLGNLRYATPTGDAGVGDFTMTDGCEVFADASGRIRKIFAKGSETDFNIKLPAEAVAEGNRRAWLNIRNPRLSW